MPRLSFSFFPKTSVGVVVAVLALVQQRALLGQAPNPPTPPASEQKPVDGIPVSDPLVISKCGTCHKQDTNGNLTRISWERTTPEGWQEAIKRMVRLNGLSLTPDEARAIVKSLSASHGLAPEEAKAVAYMSEHRSDDETYPNDNIRTTCAACHPFGRAASFRRSPEEWKLLADLHVALYPVVELTAFRRRPGPPPPGQAAPPPDAPRAPQPVDQAIEFLTKTYPLMTPEWASWRTRERAPKLAGKWLVMAHVVGKGLYSGEVTVDSGASADEFNTRIRMTPVAGGRTIERTGKAAVFSGYAWRGRSTGQPSGSGPDDIPAEWRESMTIAPDQSAAEGRWFWGAYDEFGMDVKLWRATGATTLLTLDRASLKIGTQAQRVRILGDSLPAQIAGADIDFGAGVTVRRVVSHTAQEVVVEVDIASNAILGRRDVAVGRAVLPNAIGVYDKVDYIKVVPRTSIARLGGGSAHPKGYEQFEVMAYNRGPDNKDNTVDDFEIGRVDVDWSLEEFHEMFSDDDKEFVGSLSQTGLFTPALDGPNPQRKQMRNNYGTVWVVATAKSDKDKDGKPLTAKSYLVVSPPLYIIWDREITP
ncbi:MAG: quinohemoprotein amine dehydrogenase subunit alpha [Acidobacteriia bacterium]|nr:quinohemoprotein amine dehydrogenase subunit alpha [Terriglobia bacterium]